MDKTVRLWGADGSARGILRGHAWTVNCLAIASNSEWLASGCGMAMVRLWNVDDYSKQSVRDASRIVVNKAAISRDSKWLITSGGQDGVVRIWDADGQVVSSILTGHKAIDELAIAPNGQWFVSVGEHVVRLWSDKGQCRAVLPGGDFAGQAIVAPSNEWLAFSSNKFLGGHNMQLCGEDGSQRAELTGYENTIDHFEIAPNSQWLVVADGNKAGLFGSDGGLREVLTGHKGSVFCLAIASNSEWIASGSEDKSIRLWGVNGHTKAVLEHQSLVRLIAITPNNKLLISTGLDGEIVLWDVSQKARCVFYTKYWGIIMSLKLSTNGELLIGVVNDTLCCWKVEQSSEKQAKLDFQWGSSCYSFFDGSKIKGADLSSANRNLLLAKGAREKNNSDAIPKQIKAESGGFGFCSPKKK